MNVKQLIIKIVKSRWFQLSIVMILFILLSIGAIRQCVRRQQIIDSYASVNDSLTHYKNKHGQDVARISVIETERNKDFLKIKSQDATIKKLQAVVKENKNKIKDGGIAAVINTETTIHDTILVIRSGDTIYFEKEDQWMTLIGQIVNDSLDLYCLFNNEFNLVVGEENGKKYSEFIALNPHTKTNSLRVYQNIPKKKRFAIGLNIGLNAGYDIIHKNVYVGPGIGISIIYIIF